MKKYNICTFFILSLCAVLATGCGKGSGGPQDPNQGNNDIDAWYPETVSFYQGDQNAYPTVYTLKYNEQHYPTYYGNDYANWNVSGSQVLGSIETNGDTIIYDYEYIGGNIYTGEPSSVHYNTLTKRSNGMSNTTPIQTWLFGYYSDLSGNVLKSFDDGTQSQNFVYDDKGNLTTIRFISDASGAQGSQDYKPGGVEGSHITITGYDDKPSPYSAVAGWRFVSDIGRGYPAEYILALSKHNPTQAITEDLDVNTGTYKLYEQDDFTYEYNDQGYPATVQIKTTYPAGGGGSGQQVFLLTYNFTYTQLK